MDCKRKGMAPDGWGPSAWTMLHFLAQEANTEKKFLEFTRFLRQLSICMPCASCRDHLKDLWKKRPHLSPDHACCSAVLVAFHTHNAVNRQLQKPDFQFENMRSVRRCEALSAAVEFFTAVAYSLRSIECMEMFSASLKTFYESSAVGMRVPCTRNACSESAVVLATQTLHGVHEPANWLAASAILLIAMVL